MIRNLFTATSGLQGHQTLLDVVGNNLANVNTTAFKAERLRFSDQFSDVLRAHTGPQANIGGTNPAQVGQGVKVAAIDSIMLQGALETTGNNLDLAIQDDGFFVVRNGNQNFFTRAGAFSIDGGGKLVDSATGFRLQRTGIVGEATATLPGFQVNGDNSIDIPIGTTIAGEATTEISFAGNLDAEAIGPLQETARINTPLTIGGVAAQAGDAINSLDQVTTAFGAGDVIEITGTTLDGKAINAQYVFTAADTVQALLDTINSAYGAFQDAAATVPSPNGATASLDVNGAITLTANRAGAGDLAINLSSRASNAGAATFSNFVLVTDGKDGDTTTTAIEIFDDQGTSHTMTLTFQKVGDNEWDMIASIGPSGDFAGFDARVDGITFNEDGSFQSVTGADTQTVVASTVAATITDTATPASTIVADETTVVTATDLVPATFVGDIVVQATVKVGDQTFTVTDSTTLDETSTLGAIETLLNGATFFGSAAANANLPAGFTATAEFDDSGVLVVTADNVGPAEITLSIATDSGISFLGDFTTTTPGQDGDDTIDFEILNLDGFDTVQNIQALFGTVNGFEGLTQFGGFTSAAATEQDGSSSGTLVDVAVQSDGVINGLFDNGRTLGLAQLAIATFTNASGLDRVANNYFSDNTNSGEAVIGFAGAGGRGTIQSGVLENSNVDVSVEFTRLITAQRGFQVNARSFTTANSVLDETVNLVR